MLRDDVLIENNGAMKIVNFTHVQTAETRRSFHLSVNTGYEAKCTSCWTPFVSACALMTHQPQVCGWHCITKRAEKRNLKRFLKEIY